MPRAMIEAAIAGAERYLCVSRSRSFPLCRPQRPWQREHHVFLATLEFFSRHPAPLAQPRDHLLHQLFGRGRAGGDADCVLALEPLALQKRGVVDQVSRTTSAFGELA